MASAPCTEGPVEETIENRESPDQERQVNFVLARCTHEEVVREQGYATSVHTPTIVMDPGEGVWVYCSYYPKYCFSREIGRWANPNDPGITREDWAKLTVLDRTTLPYDEVFDDTNTPQRAFQTLEEYWVNDRSVEVYTVPLPGWKLQVAPWNRAFDFEAGRLLPDSPVWRRRERNWEFPDNYLYDPHWRRLHAKETP